MIDIFASHKQTGEYGDDMARLFPDEFTEYVTPSGKIKRKMARNITFQVTDDCCMACTYCYQHNKHHHIMDFATAKKFIDIILSPNNEYVTPERSPAVIFDFIGGEPFMAIDLIMQICDYITDELIRLNHPWLHRHKFSLCSNGLLYFEPKVQEFFAKYNDRLSFSISIDGNKMLHDACRVDLDGQGTYDRAMAAVNHYREYYKGFMGSKMTLSPENIAFTKDAVVGLIESGYKDIHLNCVFEEGWEYSHGTILYSELKELANYFVDNELYKTHYITMFQSDSFRPMDESENENWCGGTDNMMLAIDYKGNLFPCLRYMESSLNDNQEPLIIGHIDRGIYQTEKEKDWQKELCDVTRRVQSTDECWNCPIAQGCAWCSAYNYEKFGTVRKRATFICPMHKAQSLANVYYWNLVAIKEGRPERFKMWLPKEKCLELISEEEYNTLKMLEEFPPININELDI